MYKVFINEKVVILTDSFDLELLRNGMLYFQYDDFEELHFVLDLLDGNADLEGIIIHFDDMDVLWADFRAHFREIRAAGGMVLNSNGDLLMIHRLKKWDLPKGKCEKHEDADACALREVEEECGITDLKNVGKLMNTYHVYSQGGFRILKTTAWYKMSSDQLALVPQREEDIEEAIWIAPAKIDWSSMPSYPNIKLLLDSHLKSTDQS